MGMVFLNGQYVRAEEAKISAFDRGFLFSDAVYEVIPIFKQHLIGFSEHLNRLEQSLNAIHLKNPYSSAEWLVIFQQLMTRNPIHQNGYLYVQLSRGAELQRSFTIPQNISPTVFATVLPSQQKPLNIRQQGFTAITYPDKRRADCFIKSTELLTSLLAQQAAHEKGVDEVVFVRDEHIIESATSNIFLIKNHKLITPPQQNGMLSGITRLILLKIAKKEGIVTEERPIPYTELLTADELWLTGSTKEIYPLIRVDDQPIGRGIVGPLWRTFVDLYENYKLTHGTSLIEKQYND